ncbi:outer membrane beta-barrel protein [Azohydromonas aeria]|uniref:outer membrane beta-barrel protein n=1 Tax=Azohydromonas aeria TaxID=2590212 RepID=UPI0012F77BEF|nr:outer membrane beta-barrel protein [Azohydromonas aeria]
MINTLPRACLYAAVCAACSAIATGAQAQISPYYLGASLTRGHDSNIFRVRPELDPASDSYTTAALLGGFDQPIGRQRVYTNLEVRQQRFDERDELDYTGHRLGAGLDWETINNISGTVKLGREKTLASYSLPFLNVVTEKNIKSENTFAATVQRGTVRNDLQVFGAFNARNTDYSASSFNNRDNRRNALRAGVNWHRSDLLTLGVAWVGARGKYPRIPDRYDSNALELTSVWKPSGASTLDGEIGYERRSFKENGQRDFSGLTGRLRWRWEPTGKLLLTTTLVRDADDTERFVEANGTDNASAGSRITNSLILDGLWKATAKISVNASFRYSDRKLVVPIQGIEEQGSDTTRRAALGATWNATNSLSLGCNVARETRSQSGDISFPFKANTANCYVQALLK